jgi:hypothetical protein
MRAEAAVLGLPVRTLLQAVARQPIEPLRLDDGDRETWFDLEQAVGTLAGFTTMAAQRRHDATVGEVVLLDDLLVAPAGIAEPGQDEVAAGVGLARVGCTNTISLQIGKIAEADRVFAPHALP